MGFIFKRKRFGSKNPLIFKKINAPYRNFSHSIDFFLSYFFEKKFQRGKRKFFLKKKKKIFFFFLKEKCFSFLDFKKRKGKEKICFFF